MLIYFLGTKSNLWGFREKCKFQWPSKCFIIKLKRLKINCFIFRMDFPKSHWILAKIMKSSNLQLSIPAQKFWTRRLKLCEIVNFIDSMTSGLLTLTLHLLDKQSWNLHTDNWLWMKSTPGFRTILRISGEMRPLGK